MARSAGSAGSALFTWPSNKILITKFQSSGNTNLTIKVEQLFSAQTMINRKKTSQDPQILFNSQ